MCFFTFTIIITGANMQLKKVQLVRSSDNSLSLIPLEEFKNGFFDFKNRDKNCEIIKINPPEVNLWVYRQYRGIDALGNEDHVASPPTDEEIDKILNEDNGVCLIQVNSSNEIASPSNGRGYRSVIIEFQVK